MPFPNKKLSPFKKKENLKILERRVLAEEASSHFKNGIYDKALELYNQALELSPNDKIALIARSKCHLLLGNPQKALEDAECALSGKVKEPHNAKALYAKAEALYHLGDFELSLVYYYRGMNIRPEFDEFRLGVQKAKEAIQNILGSNKLPMSSKSTSTAKSQKQKENFDDVKLNRPKTGKPAHVLTKDSKTESMISKKEVKRSISAQREKTATRRDSYYEANLLSQLNADRKYLQSLLKRPDLKAAHQESARHIVVHAEEGFNFLRSRQEFWRQQRTIKAVKSDGNNKKIN